MDIRKLQRAIVDGLEDVKAQAIEVFNTEALSPLFERVIVATGASNRQTKALAASVRDAVRERGMQVMRTEGEENGEWIIVDCGAAVAHIMQPAIRDYYHLEEIWGGKNVNVKLGAKAGGLVKASEPAAPAKKTAARKAAPAKAPASPAKKAAPARPAARKAAPGRNPGTAAKPAAGARKPATSAARSAAPAARKTAVAKKAAPARKTASRKG